ncbi:hypothetical protein H6P81_006876 [Aristolochia fimbriata]|uniref:Uncharacterized protein n=1 Tax=Aristolochia fimbriata TaxID=158543 RepID=A0AAV7F1Z8_ARIFI|nr:hypothetical protein H6P81_006876 [Aristolochia fimbriata]
MNPLTLVKRIQKINSTEAALGISEDASWHTKYKDSAYVYVGGVPYDLTEGDLLAVFSQYGEVVDVNLVRDKATGKSKGFAFLAYEDQRSTVLAVDNLNGAKILGRIIRVDHVSKYKKKEEEDEEAEQQKREARGVCRAFQRGECTRGASCKFSHDEQRSANTGWGAKDDSKSRWGHDKYDDPPKTHEKSRFATSDNDLHSRAKRRDPKSRYAEYDALRSRKESDYGDGKHCLKDKDRRELQRWSDGHEREDPCRIRDEKQSERPEKESPGRSRDAKWSEMHEKDHSIRSRDEKRSERPEKEIPGRSRDAKWSEMHEKDHSIRSRDEKRSERPEKESPGRSRNAKWSGMHEKDHSIRSRDEKQSGKHQDEANRKQDRERRSSRHDPESYMREERGKRSHEYRSRYDEDKIRYDEDKISSDSLLCLWRWELQYPIGSWLVLATRAQKVSDVYVYNYCTTLNA